MNFKSRTFAGRLTRRIILVLLLTMAVVTWLILLKATNAMTRETEARYQDIMTITNERLEKVLIAVEVSAANNVDEIERSLDTPQLLQEALKNELQLNTHLIGCGVAFKPNFFAQEGELYEPYATRTADGIVIVRQIASKGIHDYRQMEWYKMGLKAGKQGHWSDPYHDNEGAGATLCTFSLPIHDKAGRVVGVFGADISLEWLKKQLKEIDRDTNESSAMVSKTSTFGHAAYSFIIGRNGDYIVHPDEKRVLSDNYFKYAKMSEDTKDDEVGHEMLKGKKGFTEFDNENIPSYIFYAPLERTGWSMAIIVPAIVIDISSYILAGVIAAIMLCGLLAVFLVCRFTIRHATKPLRYLANSTDELAKGNFDTPLPTIKHNDEIHRLRDSFEKMEHSLAQYISELKETTAQKASMESELNIAHGIQMAMLPKTFRLAAEYKDIDVYGSLTPAKAVGGDLYDFCVRNRKLFFCIGDVSGKGVPASLVMAVTSSMFQTLSEKEDRPDKIATMINSAVCLHNDSGMFVTFFIGVLDLQTGLLQYCNAGHEAPLLIIPNTGEKEAETYSYEPLDVEPNLPIGVMEDTVYKLQETTITAGTTLFLYTDGLSEAEDSQHTQFGKERITEVAQRSFVPDYQVRMKDFIYSMTAAVHRFVGNAEQSDDLTMFAIRVKEVKG